MRFIVFFNDHPKVQKFDVRAWDNATPHPNFAGEMTHPKFVQHYHIDESAVSSVGNIDYNEKTGKWEFLSKPGCLFVGTNETRKKADKILALKYIQTKFGNDEEAIRQSLYEQKCAQYNQMLSYARKNQRAVK